MEFEYKYTCPDIDAAIETVQDEVKDTIDDLVAEVCPILSDKARQEFLKSHLVEINRIIINNFETIRTLNSDMRDEAERQMVEGNEELEASEELVEEHEQTIERLENELTEMQIEFDND